MDKQTPNDDPLDLPEGMTRLFIGLLKKGPAWSAETTPQVTEHQRAHLALLTQLGKSGKLLIAGPTPDGSDLRGIVVIRESSLEAARELFREDPHLQAGRLDLELHPWFVSREVLIKLLR